MSALPDPADATLPEADRRELIVWTAACAMRLLPVFAEDRPDDPRLRDALDGALAFSRGELGVGAVRELAFGCHAAARDAASTAATAAARACGQAVAVAHMAGHSRHVPAYAAKALPARDLRDAELVWQRSTVPARFAVYVYGPRARPVGTLTAPDD